MFKTERQLQNPDTNQNKGTVYLTNVKKTNKEKNMTQTLFNKRNCESCIVLITLNQIRQYS